MHKIKFYAQTTKKAENLALLHFLRRYERPRHIIDKNVNSQKRNRPEHKSPQPVIIACIPEGHGESQSHNADVLEPELYFCKAGAVQVCARKHRKKVVAHAEYHHGYETQQKNVCMRGRKR